MRLASLSMSSPALQPNIGDAGYWVKTCCAQEGAACFLNSGDGILILRAYGAVAEAIDVRTGEASPTDRRTFADDPTRRIWSPGKSICFAK
jgi:hypothetical protein